MNEPWKIAALGALGGTALSLVLVFAAAFTGLLPHPPLDGRQVRTYMLSHPQLLSDMMSELQDQQADAEDATRQAAVNKVGLHAFFDPRIAFVTGPTNAKTTIVEFYDYDCPFCRGSLPAMIKYYAAHRADTRFAFIEFPIPSAHGPSATLAAEVSLAARRQPDKFMALHFALMNQTGTLTEQTIQDAAAQAGLDLAKLKADMQDPAIDKMIAISGDLAHRALIDGTPTFIVNGRVRAGQIDDATLRDMVAGKAT